MSGSIRRKRYRAGTMGTVEGMPIFIQLPSRRLGLNHGESTLFPLTFCNSGYCLMLLILPMFKTEYKL